MKKAGDGDSLELVKFIDLMSASEVNLTDKDIERLVKIIVVLSDDEASSNVSLPLGV